VSTLAIIGGTGLTTLAGLRLERHDAMSTPWGEPSAPLLRGQAGGQPIVFLPRHGTAHAIAPHAVNYRANIWALRAAGVHQVIAVNAVGGINDGFAPGTLAVPAQLIDYSWGRAHTFCDGPTQPLQHVDFTAPYSHPLRAELLAAATAAGMHARDGGVYAVTQGPRLETAAEIERLARDGCDLVGMTGMPEAGLAREAGLEYACLAVVVNWAAGRSDGIHAELERWVNAGMAGAQRVLGALLAARGAA
jgi:5'-methylthioinosine phosphorylase